MKVGGGELVCCDQPMEIISGQEVKTWQNQSKGLRPNKTC
ncbi:MAG: hypothetical protein ACC651_15785 [Candidatus Scalindua sp.]